MKSIFRLALIGAISLFFPQVSPGMAADFGNAADLSVEIVLPDGTHKFVASAGKDLGDYNGPGFIEQNVLVSDAAIPLRVFFRPDRNSPRTEVVFEWGDAFKATSSELPAYDVRILKAGAELAAVHVPKQYWLTRWRWQSEPRKVIRTASDLLKEKLVPPYADLGLGAVIPPATPYSIMGTSSVTPYMSSTGERGDIGLVPEITARYLITGSKTDLASMLAWAEVSGTAAWHMRDPATFSAISYAKYPNASTYGEPRGQQPELMLNSTSPIAIDGSHLPQLSYVPFLLTGDPYYLEELEFTLTYTLGCYPGHETIIRHDQTRMFAWTLRDLFYLVKALPDNTPQWLLPKSYWTKILDKNLKWTMENFVNNPSFKTAGLHSGIEDRIAFWQEDYLAAVIGAGVWMGFQDWQPVFAWKIQSNIARTDGLSGWPRSDPSFYWTEWKDKSGNPVNSWASLAALNNIPSGNDRLSSQVTMSYVVYDRAVLVLATKLGISAAQPPLDWLNAQIDRRQIAWRTSLN
jgi:hypothetical protein